MTVKKMYHLKFYIMGSIHNRFTIKSKSLIYESEIEYISKCVLDYPEIETGGDLFGFWTYSGFPVIQYVIGPGKNSNHEIAFFNQDAEYLENIGNLLRKTHGLQHIGEWHSHHRLGIAEPSSHDITTVTSAIKSYNLERFFLAIANIRQNSSTINGFMFKKEQGRIFDYSGWVILDGNSPIRNSFDKKFKKHVYKPKNIKPSIIDLTISTLEKTEYIKPEYVKEYWLWDKSNQVILKKIFDSLDLFVQNLKILQNILDKSIYLQFDYKSIKYYLFFPLDFPLAKPTIGFLENDKIKQLDTTNIQWDSENELSALVVNFIQSATGVIRNDFFHKKLT